MHWHEGRYLQWFVPEINLTLVFFKRHINIRGLFDAKNIFVKEQQWYYWTDSWRNHHHYHHVVPLGRISLNLSRHFSLSFIASGRSSGLYPESSHNCCMYVRVGLPAFAWPYAGVHRSTSLLRSSLLLQQCPACLVRLAWIIFVMGGNERYSVIGFRTAVWFGFFFNGISNFVDYLMPKPFS